MKIVHGFTCDLCSAPDADKVRGHVDFLVTVHETCDEGARKNDRSLREHYIRLGLIRPGYGLKKEGDDVKPRSEGNLPRRR